MVTVFAVCWRKLHQCRHCLHMRNLNSDLDYLLIFRCKRSKHAGCQVLPTCFVIHDWKLDMIVMIYSAGTRICVTVQGITVDHTALSPTTLNLIWNAGVNSRVMTRETLTQSLSIVSVYPLHYFTTNSDGCQDENHNKWDLMFGFW